MMKANWVNQRDIDRKKWDALVEKTPDASIYIRSFYLDAVASDWEAYIADDYSFAIPVGVVKKGGLTRAYPPLFQRYLEVLGDSSKIDFSILEKELLKRYKKGNIHFKQAVFPSIHNEKFIYQALAADELDLRSQAKRMINRCKKTDYEIVQNHDNKLELIQLVLDELAKKLPIYASKDANYLRKVILEAANNNHLYTVSVYKGKELHGGLIGMEYNNTLLYLKGAAKDEAQKEGVMYAMMKHFIDYGQSKGMRIDFGGSRVENVRFFYTRFGGSDVEYYHYSWDHSPFYYRWLFNLYNFLKKR